MIDNRQETYEEKIEHLKKLSGWDKKKIKAIYRNGF